jgi:ankyrin repeat protein
MSDLNSEEKMKAIFGKDYYGAERRHCHLHILAVRDALSDFIQYAALWPSRINRSAVELFGLVDDAVVVGTPIQSALRNAGQNKHEIVGYICQHFPVSLSVADDKGALPTHYAARYASLDVFKTVLDATAVANVMHKNDCGDTFAHWACCREDGYEDNINYICESYPALLSVANMAGEYPLHVASQYSSLAAFEKILETYPSAIDAVSHENRLMNSASRKRDLDFSYELAQNGLFGGTVAHHATARGDGNTDIILFIAREYSRLLEIPDDIGCLPLHSMLDCKSLFRVNAFEAVYSAFPAAINIMDNEGHLPIHHFLSYNEFDTEAMLATLRFLLKHHMGDLEVTLNPEWPECVKRIMLRVKPQLDMAEYRELNWQHRKMAMWMAVGAVIFGDNNNDNNNNNNNNNNDNNNEQTGIIIRMLNQRGQADMVREVLSFL